MDGPRRAADADSGSCLRLPGFGAYAEAWQPIAGDLTCRADGHVSIINDGSCITDHQVARAARVQPGLIWVSKLKGNGKVLMTVIMRSPEISRSRDLNP